MLIAAITSCTNTSNPSVMLAAGLLARKAREARPEGQAVGEDQPCARLARRHGLLHQGRPAGRSGRRRLLSRRLRLHHLHRQLRAAQAGDLRRGEGRRSHRLRGALRQPQLRGPRASGSAHELPRLAAAGGRVRACRHAGHRSHHASRSAPAADGKPVYLADIWPTRPGSAGDAAALDRLADVPPQLRRVSSQGDANWASIKVPAGKLYAGTQSPPT